MDRIIRGLGKRRVVKRTEQDYIDMLDDLRYQRDKAKADTKRIQAILDRKESRPTAIGSMAKELNKAIVDATEELPRISRTKVRNDLSIVVKKVIDKY